MNRTSISTIRCRETFFAANPPPWDDITEACYHGQFSDKLDERLDAMTRHFVFAPSEIQIGGSVKYSLVM